MRRVTRDIDRPVVIVIHIRPRVVRVGQFVPGESPVAEDADIVAVAPGLVVVHGPVHHRLPGDVIALVGVKPEGCPNVVQVTSRRRPNAITISSK